MADSDRDVRHDNVIRADFLEHSLSRGTARRQKDAAARKARDARGEGDAETLSVIDAARREHKIAVEQFEEGLVQIQARLDHADRVKEQIAAARMMAPLVDGLADQMLYVDDDGVKHKSMAAYVLGWAVIKGTEEDLETLVDEVRAAIPRAKAWRKSGAPLCMADSLVACFPQLADISPRSVTLVKYDLMGRPARGKASLIAKVDLNDLRLAMLDSVLTFIQLLQPYLTERFETWRGEPRVKLLRTICIDGRVTASPGLPQNYPFSYRQIRNGVPEADLSPEQRNLLYWLTRLQASPIKHGENDEFKVGHNVVRVTIPELHLCVWIDLVPAGNSERFWDAVIFDIEDPDNPKCRTESDTLLSFLEVWASLAAGADDEHPVPVPEVVYGDGSLSNYRVHREAHNRFSVKIVSPPSKGTLRAHRNRELKKLIESGSLTLEDFSHAELARVQDEQKTRPAEKRKTPAELLRACTLTAFSDGELDRIAFEKRIRPYGRQICCENAMQARDDSDYPTLAWREKFNLAWGEDITKVLRRGSKARAYRPGFGCQCGNTKRVSFAGNELEFPGVPHMAKVMNVADADNVDKRPWDKLSAERAALKGAPFSRREGLHNSAQKNGHGRDGTTRRAWGKDFKLQQILAVLSAAFGNSLTMVHITGVYDAVCEAWGTPEDEDLVA